MNAAYRRLETPVHAVHPLPMAAWAMAMTVAALLVSDPLMIFSLFLGTAAYAAVGRIFGRWLLFMRLGVALCILVLAVNVLVDRNGATEIFSLPWTLPVLGRIEVTIESLAFGLLRCGRLLVVLSVGAIVTLAVSPDELFGLFLKTRLPARTAFLVSLAARFVPALIKDAGDLAVSLRSRGYELDGCGRIARARRRAALVVPLLSNSLDRAIQAAEAMEARGFGSGKRCTFFGGRRFSGGDTAALLCALFPAATAAGILVYGVGTFTFYPVISSPWPLAVRAPAALALFIAATALLAAAAGRRRG